MKKTLVLFLLLIVGLAAAVALTGIGCGKVAEETTTTGGGGSSTSTTSSTTTSSSGGTSTTVVFKSASQNSWVVSTSPASNESADILSYAGWNTGTYESYIQFDVSDIPPGTTIRRADLGLYSNSVSVAASPFSMNVDLYNLAAPWNQTTLIWNNKPASTGTAVAAKLLTFSDTDIYVTTDLTSAVQGWVNTPSSNNGLVIRSIITVAQNLFSYNSKNSASNKPYLEIWY